MNNKYLAVVRFASR